MERLTTPAAIMNECDKHMTPLNDQVLTSLGATEKERTEIEPYLNDILLTFQGIAGKDFNSNFVALFLTNILFRALALLRMFPKKDFDVVLSNALIGVGVQAWKQQETTNAGKDQSQSPIVEGAAPINPAESGASGPSSTGE